MRKTFAIVVTLAITCFVYPFCMPLSSATGDGTEGNPFQVATYDDLCKVGTDIDGWSMTSYYLQTANIQCPTSPADNFSPIGVDGNTFRGQYNGDNYSISNIYIYYPSNSEIGFFGYTSGATLKNIRLANVDITGYTEVGGMAGRFSNGLADNCSVNGRITGDSTVGGFIGFNDYGTIKDSYTDIYASSTTTSGFSQCGGFIGRNFAGLVERCYSMGTVKGENQEVGGFVGLIEYTYGGTMRNCYSRCNVNAGSNMGQGGFIGYNARGNLSYCYSTGTVPGGGSNKGGFCGQKETGGGYDDIYNFFDNETSGWMTSSMGTGKYSSDMKNQLTFTDWDFVNVWNISQTINDGYPFLRMENLTPCGLIFMNPHPENRSWCEKKSLSLWNITIVDIYGNTFNWSITTSPDVGSSSGNDATNGSKSTSLSGLKYMHKYYVYVSAISDGKWKNETYWFRVRESANYCSCRIDQKVKPTSPISVSQDGVADIQSTDGINNATPGFESMIFIAAMIACCGIIAYRGKKE